MKRKGLALGLGLLGFFIFAESRAWAIPSFARQTNLSCNSCHIIFPRLNSFGRLFKLNGYTLTGIRAIESQGQNNPSLKLISFMPISAMVQASVTSIRTAEPGADSSAGSLPQQLSFFLAGEITPHLGTFIQVTYDDQDAQFGMDNTDIRLAFSTTVASKRTILGLTLNNGPTVQDVWNSTPIWGFPFAASGWAPAPGTNTLVDGQLAGEVAGLGGYAFFDNLAYGEFSVYASTPQGGPTPPDGTSTSTIKGVSPYWRFVLQHEWGGAQYLSVGTYGLFSRLYPSGTAGPSDRYTDVAADLQFERTIGEGGVQVYGTWIHESRNLEASFLSGAAAAASGHVRTLKANASYQLSHTYVFTLGFFDTTGSPDMYLYPPSKENGYRVNRPNSSGFILEASLYAWQNMLLTAQYTLYTKFNGAGDDYNGFGRNAADNNTLYLLLWIAF